MSDSINPEIPAPESNFQRIKPILVHSILFVLTFFTTALAGVQWLNRNPVELANFPSGLPYAFLILLMLGSHEFGHYIAARRHGVDATLPYFLPFPAFFGFFPFGTLGAVIKLRSAVSSRKVIFDIGVAGPLAGFVVSAVVLIIGFLTLPSIEFLYTIHPEYRHMAAIPQNGLTFGPTLFYVAAGQLFAPAGSFIPPMNEIYHYPFLCVGWFGMFVTAMNLIPVAQLDGGHIAAAMFPERSVLIARVALAGLVIIGLLGLLPLIDIPFVWGWSGWLFWAVMLIIFMRGLNSPRPPFEDSEPLDSTRMLLGWLCLAIFIGSFSLAPFTLEIP